jgi:hypothetical protein
LDVAIPRALATVDDHGCNALGIACEVSSSANLIEELVTFNPGTMNVMDRKEWTPLGKACQRDNLPREALEGLLEKCPRKWPTYIDENPKIKYTILNELCQYGASLEVFRLLVNRFPECLRTKGTNLRATPLYLACLLERSLSRL